VLLIDASVWIAASDPDDRFHADSASLVVEAEVPVAALDLTLYEIANGFGVRRGFPSQAASLNRLAEEFAATLTRVHTLADTIDAKAAEVAREAGDASAERQLHALVKELDKTLDFFRVQPRRIIHEDDSTNPAEPPAR